MSKSFVTILRKPDKKLKKACEDIAKRDPSFKYKIICDRILIYSKNKDQAYKRGMWLKYKVNPELTFSVKEIEIKEKQKI